MAAPTGLLPPFVFSLTVGISAVTALVAWIRFRTAGGPFRAALRMAAVTTACLSLVGVGVVWWFAGGLWSVAAALLASGVVASVVLVVLPVWVGQRLVRTVRGVDADTALRLSTAGWPVAMLGVFGLLVFPTGGDTLLALGGPRRCLAGFCGVAVSLVVGSSAAATVAAVGPGLVGLLCHSRSFSLSRSRYG